MADLSFEAIHLLRTMRSSDEYKKTPLRNDKERAAMNELEDAELVTVIQLALHKYAWALTLRGSTYPLTKL